MQTMIFDGHNDILTQLMLHGGVQAAEQFGKRSEFHVDAIKAREGGLGGGFFAIWVPSRDGADYSENMRKEQYDIPLPPSVEEKEALAVVLDQVAILKRLEAHRYLRLCTEVSALRDAFVDESLAVVMHLEGAEALDPDLYLLDVLYRDGLRSLGPVWSRSNRFGHGVPFRFPSTPDIGEGLTEAGIALVRRCEELGILIDLSHLNLKGFEDIATLSRRPLVATHSNAHTLCPHARNLTDEQLQTIAASGGLVGVNFASAFLREDGRMQADVPLGTVLAHIDHLLAILGEDGVALGSDYDGALPPAELADVAHLPALIAAMQDHGYGEELIRKIAHENWFDVLERSWRPTDAD